MTPGARLAAVTELLDALLRDGKPADQVFQSYTKTRRYIGAKDRRALGALFWEVLRHRARLGWWCGQAGLPDGARTLVLAAQVLLGRQPVADLKELCNGAAHNPPPLTGQETAAFNKWEGQPLEPDVMPDAVRAECPPDFLASLQAAFGTGFMDELRALVPPAPVDIRINTHKATREHVRQALAAAGIASAPVDGLETALRLPSQPGNLQGTPGWIQGLFEIQDASSQRAALALAGFKPKTVLDFCAGAGGKTLALADALPDSTVFATDHDPSRLERLLPRLRRSGYGNVVIGQPEGKAEAVLVDAPCTGSGTWRRNPDARWRYAPADLAAFVTLQRDILHRAAARVEPGGVLMYCTCSILPAENGGQRDAFTASHPDFVPLPLPDILPPDGQMTPHRTETDGFFVAMWRKNV